MQLPGSGPGKAALNIPCERSGLIESPKIPECGAAPGVEIPAVEIPGVEIAGAAVPARSAALHSMGCRLNHGETAVLRASLEQAGYRIVPWGEQADLLVLNSCTVTSQADAKGRQSLRAMRRRFPHATLALVGCYAQIDGAALAREGLADIVIGNARKLELVSLLEAWQGPATSKPPGLATGIQPDRQALLVRDPMPRQPFRQELFAAPHASTRAHLKVQDGCDFMCSFCIIPVARGRARPREMDNLLAEARHLAQAGVKELVLTGVNLGTYGHRNRGLTVVVDALAQIEGVARIRISSIEPTTVDEALIERMADRAHPLAPFLHLPLQSASPPVLSAMGRRYGPSAYRDFAERALAAVPGLCLGTDVMVGFPGERDGDFQATVDFLDSMAFTYCHVFPYSERGGTRAMRLPDPVAPAIRRQRAAKVRDMSDRMRRRFHERFIGDTLPVLFEASSVEGEASGYTENYMRVRVAHAQPHTLRNRIQNVRLLEAGASAISGELDHDGAV